MNAPTIEKVDKVLDLKCLLCPMPIVKIAKAVKEVQIGQLVEAALA